jgi:hypothetical protein
MLVGRRPDQDVIPPNTNFEERRRG